MSDIPRPDTATSVPRSERKEDEEGVPPVRNKEQTTSKKDVELDEPKTVAKDIEVVVGNEKLVMIQQLAVINNLVNVLVGQNERIIELLESAANKG